MIYAQRPDATACAEYDLWNEKMGRYVRRGSKGIALVDDSGDRPRLRYVFDISDTGTREHSRTPWLWQLEERHLDSVQAMLERTYDVSDDDLAGQLTEVAGKLAEEYCCLLYTSFDGRLRHKGRLCKPAPRCGL